MTTTANRTTVLAASTITGNSVRNPQGEELGSIKDIMIDLSSGRIAYAVLSFGGFMGFGDKLFAIPFSALKPGRDENTFELDIDQERLKRARGFDKNDWPNMADRTWQTEVHDLYGSEPYWESPRYYQG